MQDDITMQELIDQLNSPNWQVRYRAVDLLKVVGDERAVPPLIAALTDDHDTVRFLVAHALGMIGDSRAVKPLVTALHTADPDTQWAAARALAEIGSAAVPALVALLEGDDPALRDIAAGVLGTIGDPRALTPLQRALEQHGKADFAHTHHFGAASGLEKFGEAATPAFVAVLNHDEPLVRARAAASLGIIRSASATDALIALLDDDAPCTKDKRVCDVAARALAKIGTPDALRALERWRK